MRMPQILFGRRQIMVDRREEKDTLAAARQRVHLGLKTTDPALVQAAAV
jgi:hypothetical protein